MEAITIHSLSKRFGAQTALHKLNLSVPEGSAFGCVGRDGGGKTTLIRILSGLLRADGGECSVLAVSPAHEGDKLHRLTGAVLDSARLYPQMTLQENLRFFAGLNRVEENDAIDRSSFLLHRLDIWEERETPARDLPTGAAYRARVARALMHSPRILFLDECGEGMDPETEDSIRGLLRELVQEEGLTLFCATGKMDFAQKLCQDFAFLHQGSFLARGNMEDLRKAAGVGYQAVLRLKEGDLPPEGFVPANGEWRREVGGEEELGRVIAETVEKGVTLYEAKLLTPTLEEIYAACLGGKREGNVYEQIDPVQEPPESEGDPEEEPLE